MIFAVVMTVSMTTIVVATVWLSSSLVRDERWYEDQVRVKFAIDGACEQAAQDYTAGTLASFPSTRNTTVNGVSCAMTITDNSANIPHTMSMAVTATYKGRSLTDTKVVGMRKAPSPFYYALFVNSGFTYTGTLTTGTSGSNGDVYVNGSLVLSGLGSTINGDLESTGTLSVNTATITGNQYPTATAVTFPTVSSANYSTVANQTVSKGSLSGATFSTTTGAYYLIYCSSSSGVSISGTFTGKGTIFVNGPVTISGPVTPANSSSRVAIIANGAITFSSSGPHSAYFYANGACTLPLGGLTITKGALVCSSLTTLGVALNVTNDNSVWLSATEGANHRLPGYYP